MQLFGVNRCACSDHPRDRRQAAGKIGSRKKRAAEIDRTAAPVRRTRKKACFSLSEYAREDVYNRMFEEDEQTGPGEIACPGGELPVHGRTGEAIAKTATELSYFQ
jgi:hypothetical protein